MNRFVGLLLILLGCSFISEIEAQVLNVEKHRHDADTSEVWAGNLSIGFEISQRNKQTIELNNETDLVYFSPINSYLMLTKFKLIKVEDRILSDGYVHLRSSFFRKNRIHPELFTQYQYSLTWGLKGRYLAGGAARIRLYQKDNFLTTLTTGAMYEYELWEPNSQISVETEYLKLTNALMMRGKITPQISVVTMAYYQSRPASFFRPRITSDISVVFEITDAFKISTGFELTHDYKPAPGIEPTIYKLENKLIFSF
jgi:hypothetical protein